MTNPTPFRATPRVILGIIVIVLGILITLRNLDIPGFHEAHRYWPLILVAIGLSRAVRPRGTPGRGVGFILLVVGIWLQLDEFDLVPAAVEDLWPLLLVGAGAYLVWQGWFRPGWGATADETDTTITAFAFLGGVVRRSTSKDFRGGELTAVMGGCEVDLTGAAIDERGAVINTFSLWGGVEIKVPESWTVVTEGMPLLGGFEDKTKSLQSDAKQRLIVRGMAIMGGVEISN